MIVVDSSTWADFFNGAATPHVERLEAALRDEEDLAVLPIVLTEVLQGFKTESGFSTARALLLALPVLQPDVDTHVRAANMFRVLRGEGVTIRGAVDCVIAQTCLDYEALLLSRDRDFEHIARYVGLRLWTG